MEYQITDRQSFKNFLGLASGDKVPDEKTVWAFSEKMSKMGLAEKLFQEFVDKLNEQNLIFNEGQIIDASFGSTIREKKTGTSRMARAMDYVTATRTRKVTRT